MGAARIGGVPRWAMGAAWFFAVLIPMVLFIEVSGAHLNPAVTLALAESGRTAWSEAPGYWLAQGGGAFLGSAGVLALLGGGAHLGATVPASGDLPRAFVAEAIFTALLVAAVFRFADSGEGRGRWRLLRPPAAVGLSTCLIRPWTGSSPNPARTLAPALLSGTYPGLWVYPTTVPAAALVVAAAWRPRSVDVKDRGPGRADARR